jgi:hypothetical protein
MSALARADEMIAAADWASKRPQGASNWGRFESTRSGMRWEIGHPHELGSALVS